MILADVTPHQNQVALCSAGGFWCTINSDTLISTGIAMAVTLVIGLLVAARLREGRPGKLQMVFEALLSYVRGLTHETVAEDAEFIVPIAVTLGFFILVANWIDFFPLAKPVVPAASDWNLTLAMALVVFLTVQAYSLRVLGPVKYLRRFTKPFELPWYVRFFPLVILLNVIEEAVKPITLSLRLFGNLLAGVIMVDLLSGVTPVMGVPFLIIWKAFDVFFIGSIQALIFMLLTIMYFGMAREGLEEEEGHGGHAAAAVNNA